MMKRTETESFCLTLPLRYEQWQRDRLDHIFNASVKIFNCLVAAEKKKLEQIERRGEWKSIQNNLAWLYQIEKTRKLSKEQVSRRRELFKRRNKILSDAGMNEYGFQSAVKKYQYHYSKLVGSMVAQKLASAVWKKFEKYLYGNGEEIRFKSWKNFFSIEGKTNGTNIRFSDGVLLIGKMKLHVAGARNEYEADALSKRVKYCRIIRMPWKDGWLYKLQLVLEGTPPVKKHRLGTGRAGIDIGTQTVAFVSEPKVRLEELVSRANTPDRELRRINRAMDRSRRATNPQFFAEDGTIVPVNQLPAECLNSRGKRKWHESRRYKKLSQQRRFLFAKLARIRKTQHEEMANRFLECGSEFYVETMRFSGLAKRAKKQNLAERKQGEKMKRRKRFGRSIANKAPAMFIDILKKKVTCQGGQFFEIDTVKARASQYCHLNHQYKKKKLSKRWNIFEDGTKVQRDLYSAFLIMNTNDRQDGFDQKLCDQTFKRFLVKHDMEIKRLQSILTPASTGVKVTA